MMLMPVLVVQTAVRGYVSNHVYKNVGSSICIGELLIALHKGSNVHECSWTSTNLHLTTRTPKPTLHVLHFL